MKKAFFVTATNTDVGKTFVSASLLKAFLDEKINAVAIKPVQSGCENGVAPDILEYKKVNPNNDFAPLYALNLATSPHYAAQKENITINLEKIVSYCNEFMAKFECIIIEGAGGVFVPLNENESIFDLIKELEIPVILVTKNELGAINQIILNIENFQNHGIEIAAIVLNFHDPNDEICASNLEYLKSKFSGFITTLEPNLTTQKAALSFKNFVQNFSPKPQEIDLNFDKNHLFHPYTSSINPLKTHGVTYAKGTKIHITNGVLIDAMSSWWCAYNGYNNALLNKAATAQINKFSHIMFGGLTHAPAINLGKKLLEILPKRCEIQDEFAEFRINTARNQFSQTNLPNNPSQQDKFAQSQDELNTIFYCDSGSVSVEVALKMALQYQQNKNARKNTIATIKGGYHGDTFGAMSVCDPENGMHFMFGKILAKQLFMPRPSVKFGGNFEISALDEYKKIIYAHKNEIAAIIVEPIVQGAGGMWFYHENYLKFLRQICDELDIILIFDEIATGFGRTGEMFASNLAHVVPDIICIGKAITAGFMSFAATITTKKIADTICQNDRVFMHGPTFMANPLACSVALKNIEMLQSSNFKDQVKHIENIISQNLAKCAEFNDVNDIRTLGAIGVIEMKRDVNVQNLQEFFVKNGVWIRPFAKNIYIMPPFCIKDYEILKICDTIYTSIKLKLY